ncbi:MAG: ParB/RepB/Spo0J family partition protein [Gaiellaceae bacterium]
MAETTEIPIDQIRIERDLWPRERLDGARVAEFAELYESDGAEALPPIEVIELDQGAYLLVEGHHRLAAAQRAGLEYLPADVLGVPPGVDLGWFVFERGVGNAARSAKPLTRREKRTATLHLLGRYPHRHDRELARLVGVSHTFVAQLRRELATLPTQARESDEVMYESARLVASRLFSATERVRQTRGLGIADKLFGDRTAQRLAEILHKSYGEDARERALEYSRWFAAASDHLDQGAKS